MIFSHIDAHAHVQFDDYDTDRDEVIARAGQQGIAHVNVGADITSSSRAVVLTRTYAEGVFATVGLHPTEKEVSTGINISAYRALAKERGVVAIGECGLDYFRLKGDENVEKKLQRDAFCAQIALAHEVKKPLMIHCRNAMSDLILLLREYRHQLNSIPGIMHFFSGSLEDARALLDMGFYFTFGGVITFSHDYDEVVKSIPLERILTETDAPYVAPVPYRGKRNEPVFVLEVEKRIAELKNIPKEELAGHIMHNAERVFHITLTQ